MESGGVRSRYNFSYIVVPALYRQNRLEVGYDYRQVEWSRLWILRGYPLCRRQRCTLLPSVPFYDQWNRRRRENVGRRFHWNCHQIISYFPQGPIDWDCSNRYRNLSRTRSRHEQWLFYLCSYGCNLQPWNHRREYCIHLRFRELRFSSNSYMLGDVINRHGRWNQCGCHIRHQSSHQSNIY